MSAFCDLFQFIPVQLFRQPSQSSLTSLTLQDLYFYTSMNLSVFYFSFTLALFTKDYRKHRSLSALIDHSVLFYLQDWGFRPKLLLYILIVYSIFIIHPLPYTLNAMIFKFYAGSSMSDFVPAVLIDCTLTTMYYWLLIMNTIFLGIKYDYAVSSNKLIIPEGKRKEVLIFMLKKSLCFSFMLFFTKLMLTFIIGIPFTLVPRYDANDPVSYGIYKVVANIFFFYYASQRGNYLTRVEHFMVVTQSEGNKKAKNLMYHKHLHNLDGLSDLYAKTIKKVRFEHVQDFKDKCKWELSSLLNEMKRDYQENIQIIDENKEQIAIQRHNREATIAENWFIRFFLLDSLLYSIGYLILLVVPSDENGRYAYVLRWGINCMVFVFYLLECLFLSFLCYLIMRDKKNMGWKPELCESLETTQGDSLKVSGVCNVTKAQVDESAIIQQVSSSENTQGLVIHDEISRESVTGFMSLD